MSTPADLALVTRVLAAHGLIGMYGHVSALADGPAGRYLLSPGAGFRKELCRAADVVELALDDEFRAGLPLELYMHSEVHRRHPEVGALVHTHAPALTELSSYADVPGQALLLHATFWPDEVPVYEPAELVVEREQAVGLTAVMAGGAPPGEPLSPVTLLRWHGAMIAGATLSEALFRALYAERNAGLLLHGLRGQGRQLAVPGGAQQAATARAIITERMLGLHWAYEAAADARRREDGS
jgi:ribulose-5-phosphate 4-epimerase/fuculose-1-phosphate aldolase